MTMKNLEDLLQHMLKDIYYAEKQIEKELPKMAEKATSADLRAAFESHLEETHQHVANIEAAFDELGMAKRGEKCDAIEGILKEAKSVMDEIEDAEAMDAGMIAAAQAVEHYEITRYGTIVAWAKQLGHDRVAQLAQENLDQEVEADAKLSDLAEGSLNRMAA